MAEKSRRDMYQHIRDRSRMLVLLEASLEWAVCSAMLAVAAIPPSLLLQWYNNPLTRRCLEQDLPALFAELLGRI